MKRSIIIAILAIACVSASFAQSGPPSKSNRPTKGKIPITSSDYEAIRKGDQFINLMAGPNFTPFTMAQGGLVTDTKLNVGGTLELGYSYFLTKEFALGGMVNFTYNPTIGQNIFFFLPIYLKGTYEMVFGRFHVPLALNVGAAFQTYNSYNFFSPAIKPEIGVYYQWSSDWSFGIESGWTFLPEWYDNPANNRTGNFLNVSAGFRYHF